MMKVTFKVCVMFQVEDLPSTMLPLLIEALQQNIPQGVTMTIKEVGIT